MTALPLITSDIYTSPFLMVKFRSIQEEWEIGKRLSTGCHTQRDTTHFGFVIALAYTLGLKACSVCQDVV